MFSGTLPNLTTAATLTGIMVEWHDQCVHISLLNSYGLTPLVMILGELCNFTGARSTSLLRTYPANYIFQPMLLLKRS